MRASICKHEKDDMRRIPLYVFKHHAGMCPLRYHTKKYKLDTISSILGEK